MMSSTLEELDLQSRELCPDGACVGVLADDGRCSVCGLDRQGAQLESVVVSSAPLDAPIDEMAPAVSADFADRQLCPDGACTGLVGPEGRCKVCGAGPTA